MGIILTELLSINYLGDLRVSSVYCIMCHLEYLYYYMYIELDKFMEVLEQRFNVQQQKKPSGIVPKKVRKVGEPSESPPPLGAPLWAIKKEFHNMGMYRV